MARARPTAVAPSESVRPVEDVDFGVMAAMVSFRLRRASWAVHHAFAAQFAPSDFVPRQYSVLYLISVNPGISVKALAGAIGVDQSTLVPTLNVCEERGWIRRERGQADRRVVALHITASGETVLQDFHRQLVAHEASICAGLSDAERKQLLALLAKIAETPAVKNQLDKK